MRIKKSAIIFSVLILLSLYCIDLRASSVVSGSGGSLSVFEEANLRNNFDSLVTEVLNPLSPSFIPSDVTLSNQLPDVSTPSTEGDFSEADSSFSIETVEDVWLDKNIGNKYTDEGVTLPTSDELSSEEQKQIKGWLNYISDTKRDSSFTASRVIRIVLGIVFLIYFILFYIAYLFDKTNTIFEVSLVSVMTLGRFIVSDDDSVSTYGVKGKGTKILVHWNVVLICITGILLSLLLMSGALFNLLLVLVNKLGTIM